MVKREWKWGSYTFTLYRHDLALFMRRWVLAHPWGAVRLHNILVADIDPELHTHPFDFVSIILRGGYVEELPADGAGPELGQKRRLRVVRWFNTSIGPKAHRIESVKPNTWTLVIGGQRLRKWGFWGAAGFVPWDEFETKKGYNIAEHKALTQAVYGESVKH
jgi:hypothetical protein